MSLQVISHSQPPWEWSPCETSGFGINNLEYGIAHVFSSNDVCKADPQEAEANARLIAAAPEMLAALKVTIYKCQLCAGTGWWRQDSMTPCPVHWCQQVRTVIAKAEPLPVEKER